MKTCSRIGRRCGAGHGSSETADFFTVQTLQLSTLSYAFGGQTVNRNDVCSELINSAQLVMKTQRGVNPFAMRFH